MMPWTNVFEIFAIITLITIVLVPILKTENKKRDKELNYNLSHALKEAMQDPTFIMLFLGFFSCGFQLAFITAHFPAFIAETSSPIIQGSIISLVCNSMEGLGALSIALIGLFNIVGSVVAGVVGKGNSKKYFLAFIYTVSYTHLTLPTTTIV